MNLQNDENSSKVDDIIKQLVSSIQGAPYPTTINNELYTIWYEHSLKAVTEAFAYLGSKPDL